LEVLIDTKLQIRGDALVRLEALKAEFGDLALPGDVTVTDVERRIEFHTSIMDDGEDRLAELHQHFAELDALEVDELDEVVRRIRVQTEIVNSSQAMVAELRERLEVGDVSDPPVVEVPVLVKPVVEIGDKVDSAIEKLKGLRAKLGKEDRTAFEKRMTPRIKAELEIPEGLDKDQRESFVTAELEKRFEAMRKIEDSSRKQLEADIDALSALKTKMETEEGLLKAKERQLATQREIMRLDEAHDKGVRQGDNVGLRFDYGASDGERLANQAEGLLRDATRRTREFAARKEEGEIGLAPTLEERGAVLSEEAQIREKLYDLERRQNEIVGERKQNELDIAAAMKEQADEAARSLLFASREEQLRAATLAAVSDGGKEKFTYDEFFFLSQGLRNTARDYLPGVVPGIRGDGPNSPTGQSAEAAEADAKLVEEKNRIGSVIGNLRDRLEALTRQIEKTFRLDDVDIKGLEGNALQDVVRGEGNVVNLNTGEIDIRLDFSDATAELATIIRDGVMERVEVELADIRSMIGAGGGGLPSAAVN